MYEKDRRIVITLDAGGTNFVFGAVQGDRFVVEPITLPSNSDRLDRCLETMVEGFRTVIGRLPEQPAAISFAFPGPADYPRGIIGGYLPNFPSFRDGVALGTVVPQINAILDEYPLPDGMSLDLGGTVEDQGDAFGDLLTLFVLIVILVYIVMATQFESLVFPFIIMFTIPLAFTGTFLALWLTGTPLSIIALIGAIMLVGIVTKNGIVLVDYTNLLVERGSSVFDAVVAGGKSRLRPVLMTSFTTILGMLPLALGTGEGSETWQPMGIAVIGGLTCSTLLTLLVVPVLYSVFVNRRIRKAQQKQAAARQVSLNA